MFVDSFARGERLREPAAKVPNGSHGSGQHGSGPCTGWRQLLPVVSARVAGALGMTGTRIVRHDWGSFSRRETLTGAAGKLAASRGLLAIRAGRYPAWPRWQ